MNFNEINRLSLNENKESKGIYIIRNIENNKFYIGSSIDIPSRWSCHKSDLKNKKHCNKFLQNTYNKYGLDKLEFIFLLDMEHDSRESILLKEQHFIDQWFDEGKNCYNLSKQANGSYTGDSDVPVYQINPQTKEIIGEYKSLAEAGRCNNIHFINVLQVCSGKRNITGGNVFCYKHDYEDFIPFARSKGLSSHVVSELKIDELYKFNNIPKDSVLCLECGQSIKNLLAFSTHLQFTHKIKAEDYTIKHFYDGVRPTCKSEGCVGLPRYATYKFKEYCKDHSCLAESAGGKKGGLAPSPNKTENKPSRSFKKEKLPRTCLLCDKTFENDSKFSAHLKPCHDGLMVLDYAVKMLYGGRRPFCKFQGCGEPTRFVDMKFKTYCKNHSTEK